MTTVVGLVGFGRIGRNLFRILYGRDDVRLAAISDWNDPEPLEYLLRFDTLLGRFPEEVSIREGNLYVVGRQIRMITGKQQGQVPWGELGVDTVLEATSRGRTRAELEAHLQAGAKRVIACSPPLEPPDITVVIGVNDEKLESRHRIVSNASSTVHCLAPIAKILHEAFGIERAIYTTVHSYTNQHRLADVPAEDMRQGRAAAENIIPQLSRSPGMVMEVVPELKGRVTGSAVAVPVRNGSAVDLVCWHSRKVTPVAINEVVRTAASTARWKRVIAYEDEPIVSSDVARSSWSSTFDSLATMVLGEKLSKTISWYDSGYGYAHRAVDLLERFARLDRAAEAPMTVRVGINGFGRIGRSVFRILAGRADTEVVAINDLFDNAHLAYLLKYDTVMRVFEHEVTADADAMWVDGRKILMTAEKDPAQIPWGKLGVEIVVESTGVILTREKLAKHLAAGAKRVILTVPPNDEIDGMIVMGVNDATLTPQHRIVSNASCTTNCLAPLAMVLDDEFGIEQGFMTTVHAYTNDQRLADVPHKDLRRSRAAAENIIPTTTGAARAVGKVLPKLAGKLDGMAMRVPVPDGSVVDLSCRLRKKPDGKEVNGAIRRAAEGPLRGILEYSEVPLVSSDVIGNPHSSIFDALSTRADGDGYLKVVSWYDNEWGYSNRVVDLIGRLAALGD